MKDIDVRLKELEAFIQTMDRFQTTASEQSKALRSAWQKCDGSWQGAAKDSFQKEFNQTTQSMNAALKDGQSSLVWLKKFRDQVVKFEKRR